jgi:hypothetical protein
MSDRDFNVKDGEWFPVMNQMAEKLTSFRLSGTEWQVLVVNTILQESKTYIRYKINSKLSTWKTLSYRKDFPTGKKNTFLQESTPIKENINKPPISPKQEKPKKKPPKRIRLTDEFSLTDNLREYALKNNIASNKVSKLFEAFKDHHIGAGKLMVDWDRAWYTWVRNAPEFSKWAMAQSIRVTAIPKNPIEDLHNAHSVLKAKGLDAFYKYAKQVNLGQDDIKTILTMKGVK